jgi:aspartyl-tRNA(Asn)/glutamyl-tRNA(Gln) amidotransferase subunit A
MAERYSAADYVDAQMRRTEFGEWMELLFERYDVIFSPATQIAAFEKEHNVPPGSGQTLWTEWAGFSFPINLSQQPAYVIPGGRTGDNRPIGLQFIGRRADDDRVLESAAAFSASIAR